MIGLGGAIIGALIAAIFQPYWSQKIGPKSRLTAKIQLNTFKIPQYLEDSIVFYRDLKWNRQANIKPTEEAIDRLYAIRNASGLAQITLTNNSKKEITGIRIGFDDNQDIIADGFYEGIKAKSHFGKVYVIESLPPRSSYKIDIWTYYNIANYSFQDINDKFKVTAKEIDNIDTIYEFSSYEEGKYFSIKKKTINKYYYIIFSLMVFATILTSIISIVRN